MTRLIGADLTGRAFALARRTYRRVLPGTLYRHWSARPRRGDGKTRPAREDLRRCCLRFGRAMGLVQSSRTALLQVSGSTSLSLSRAGAYMKMGAMHPSISPKLKKRSYSSSVLLFAPLPPCAAARIAVPGRRAHSTPLPTDGNARAHGRVSPRPPRPGPVRHGRGRTLDWCFGQPSPASYSACWSFAACTCSSFAGCSLLGSSRVDSSAGCKLTALILPRLSC